MKRAILSIVGSLVKERAQEPSTYIGAGIAALGVQNFPDASAPIMSGEFIQALAIVIAGILAMLFTEREKDHAENSPRTRK